MPLARVLLLKAMEPFPTLITPLLCAPWSSSSSKSRLLALCRLLVIIFAFTDVLLELLVGLERPLTCVDDVSPFIADECEPLAMTFFGLTSTAVSLILWYTLFLMEAIYSTSLYWATVLLVPFNSITQLCNNSITNEWKHSQFNFISSNKVWCKVVFIWKDEFICPWQSKLSNLWVEP